MMASKDSQKPQQHDPEIESSVTESVDEADNPSTSIYNESQDLSDKMAPLSMGGSSADVEAHALAMQERCRDLLSELEEFQAYLKQQKKESSVELRTFKGGLQAEMKLLDKVCLSLFRHKLLKSRPNSPVACNSRPFRS